MASSECRFILFGGKDSDSFHRGVLGRFHTESEATWFAELSEREGRIDWWLLADSATGTMKESTQTTPQAEEIAGCEVETVQVLPAVLPDSSSSAAESWAGC